MKTGKDENAFHGFLPSSLFASWRLQDASECYGNTSGAKRVYRRFNELKLGDDIYVDTLMPVFIVRSGKDRVAGVDIVLDR